MIYGLTYYQKMPLNKASDTTKIGWDRGQTMLNPLLAIPMEFASLHGIRPAYLILAAMISEQGSEMYVDWQSFRR